MSCIALRVMVAVGLSCAAVMLSPSTAFAAGRDEMPANGRFEQVDKDNPDMPIAWNARFADFMPDKRKDEDGRTVYHYVLSSGVDMGTVKPWVGLRCPKTGAFISGEESGDWYAENHLIVKRDRGRSGAGLKMDIPGSVGANQGCRIMSDVIPVKRDTGFHFTGDVRTTGGASAMIFIEAYRYRRSDRTEGMNDDVDLSKLPRPIERCFRTQIRCDNPAAWTTFREEVVAPQRYHFDFIVVKLVGLMGGEVYFDNLRLTPMSAGELARFKAEKNKKVREKRFAY